MLYRAAWPPQLTRVANEYRTCETELLAGNPCLETVVKESGATFGLDYGTVRSVAPACSVVWSATRCCAKSSGRFDIGQNPCQREHTRFE
jgi:tRNA G37 N-methylase Trm5